MKILIYKGQSGYDALRVFADEIAYNLERLGHEIRILDFMEPGKEEKLNGLLREVQEKKGDFFPDLIFSMNGIGINIKASNGRLFHNELGVPFVSYIVDHPLYHHGRLKTKLKNHHVFCVNEGYKEYVERYYSPESVSILMQAGIEGMKIKDFHIPLVRDGTLRMPQDMENEGDAEDNAARPYEVVFLGTYRREREIEAQIEASAPAVKNVSICMIEELINNPGLRLEEGLGLVLKKQGIVLKPEAFADTMNAMHLADKYVRALYRKLAVKSLLQNGIRVDVWGEHWQELKQELSSPELLTVHEPVSYREAAEVYGQAKIVLNVMPWAKEGLHDRMLTAMLAGAVCVTDETADLKSGWSDREYALIYSLSNMKKLPVMVKNLLMDEKRMETMAGNAYEKAHKEHTWKQRAEDLEKELLRIKG